MAPYFDRLVERMNREPEAFPSWVGELYLEYHRGTLTSVAKNKRNNRLAERKLHDLELLATLAAAQGHDYPAAQLERLWKTVLLNQFHDILPGTSIGFVYEDSDRDYAAFFEEAEALARGLAGTLAAVGTHALLNPTSRSRSELLFLSEVTEGIEIAGQTTPAQTICRADGSTETAVPVSDVHALSVQPVRLATAASTLPPSRLNVSPTLLENDLLRARFNAKGQLVSLFDKVRNREALKAGEIGNALVAYRDIPIDFDAWDIDENFEANPGPWTTSSR